MSRGQQTARLQELEATNEGALLLILRRKESVCPLAPEGWKGRGLYRCHLDLTKKGTKENSLGVE